MRNLNRYAIILLGLTLSSCASLNSFADDVGINFWSHSEKKAPCKVASMSKDVPCEGIKLTHPSDDDKLILRGSYGLG